MIGPSYHLFHLSNYYMFIKGINWLLSAINSTPIRNVNYNKKHMHTGQCLRRIAGGNVGLPLDTT